MRKETVKTTSNGGGTLFLVFLVLKLTNVIDWSWWWVTSPLWIPLAVVVIIFLVATPIILLIQKILDK